MIPSFSSMSVLTRGGDGNGTESKDANGKAQDLRDEHCEEKI